jgi:hypothetical protein
LKGLLHAGKGQPLFYSTLIGKAIFCFYLVNRINPMGRFQIMEISPKQLQVATGNSHTSLTS